MTRLARYPAYLSYLLRRIPVVVREGRVPAGPRELWRRLRRSFQLFSAAVGRPTPWIPPPVPPAPPPGTARLLFLAHNLNLEGAPISQLLVACGLDRRRYEPRVLAVEDGPLRARYAAAGVPVEVSEALRGVHDGESFRERIQELAEWVKRADVALVFCNTLLCFWGVAVARAAGVPSVWCIRESVDWRHYFDDLRPPLARAAVDCLGAADRLVFVADATRRLFPEPPPPARAEVIPNGVDLAEIETFKRERSRQAARAAHGIADGARVISVIGTTCQRKGQIDFLHAAAALARRRPDGLRFYVVGARQGKYLRDLRQFVQDERLRSVVFVDETPAVFEYYRLSDVFVCSSYEESFPRVILEAMAFGLPIVSTNVFGIPEAIRDGWSGLLVDPGDVAGLAAAVERLLDDPPLAERLAVNAYATVADRFTADAMVRRYDQVFAECLR